MNKDWSVYCSEDNVVLREGLTRLEAKIYAYKWAEYLRVHATSVGYFPAVRVDAHRSEVTVGFRALSVAQCKSDPAVYHFLLPVPRVILCGCKLEEADL